MSIKKRTYIDNSIFKELNAKYPPLDADNGVAYKQKLDYLTFETNFMKNAALRMLIQNYGHGVISIIFYLRTAMCENGWKIRIDDTYYKFMVRDCSYACNIDTTITEQIIQELINSRFFYVVQDNEVEDGVWMTCIQQVYNYEMACNNRQQSRKRKSKSREKAKAEERNEILRHAAEQENEISPYDGFHGNYPAYDDYPYDGIPCDDYPFNGAPCDDYSYGNVSSDNCPIVDTENCAMHMELEDNPFGMSC